MQVSVCYLWSRGSLRKGHRGTPGLKNNMISFPPHIADLKILAHFFSRLGEHDVVDVRVRAGDADDDEEAPSTLRRARVLQLLPDGVQVQLDDNEETAGGSRIVDLKDIEQRVSGDSLERRPLC